MGSFRRKYTVLIMYGDHLPTLGIEDAELSNGDIFQTEYVIWNNFGLEKQDADIEAYQLGAHVLNQLDIHHGTLINYHQQHQESADYLDNLKVQHLQFLVSVNDPHT